LSADSIVPFLVEEYVLIYSANQMTTSLGTLQSKLKTKNLLENYTLILMVVSIILGSVSLVGAEKVQKYLGMETKRKPQSGSSEESKLLQYNDNSKLIELSGLEGAFPNKRVGQFRKSSAELLAETCSPDVTLSEKMGDDSDGETSEL
jgi:hypothetical protein